MNPHFKIVLLLLFWLPCLFVEAAENEMALTDSQQVAATENTSSLERFNHSVFEFNDLLDGVILKPVAKSYEKIVPKPVNKGVTNFFGNLGEIANIMNALLQGKPLVAGDSLFRFLINSTFGVLGIFDIAGKSGLDEHKEDFGQTLAVWGVPSGPYLVLPFFGPSDFRDGPARLGDVAFNPVSYVENWPLYVSMEAADIVDSRADLLDAEKLISGDRYLFLKNAYLQNRNYLIHDGKVVDTFDTGGFDDDNWLDD